MLDDKGAVPSNSWVEFDVTAAISGNGTYTFDLASVSADSTDMYSRQGTYPPQLVITTVANPSANAGVDQSAKEGSSVSFAGTASGSTQVLSQGALQPLVQEAIARWEATGLTAAQVSLLKSASIQVADLGGTTLGLTSGNVITIDDNAASWGWFIDATPANDSEFRKPGDQGEQNHMDLLTVFMHEMGHVLGLDHEPRGVRQETLAPGTRLSPSRLDLHFAGLADRADVALAVALADEAHRK